jgi:hypothetical protein
MAESEFDDFCRFAFSFLEGERTRFLVVGGLAVVVVGEPRTTADADAIVFVSQAEAESLIGRAAAAGVVRRHGDRLDVAYLERTLRPICELAEDMAPWNRLHRVLTSAPPEGP